MCCSCPPSHRSGVSELVPTSSFGLNGTWFALNVTGGFIWWPSTFYLLLGFFYDWNSHRFLQTHLTKPLSGHWCIPSQLLNESTPKVWEDLHAPQKTIKVTLILPFHFLSLLVDDDNDMQQAGVWVFVGFVFSPQSFGCVAETFAARPLEWSPDLSPLAPAFFFSARQLLIEWWWWGPCTVAQCTVFPYNPCAHIQSHLIHRGGSEESSGSGCGPSSRAQLSSPSSQ